MKITEENSFRPITIVLETEEEAKELLGILWRVDVFREKVPDHVKAVVSLRDALHNRLGVSMEGLYQGTLTRNGI